MSKLFILGLLVLVFTTGYTAEQQTTEKKIIRIGVLAFRGVEQTQLLWTPTANYLSNALPGFDFRIIALNHPDMRTALKKGGLEFVLTNTGHYVELEADFGITRIATLVNRYGELSLTQFGSVIFTRAKHPSVKSINDLSGKRFIAVKPYAFGGFRMAWYELLKHGIDPYKDLKRISFSGFPVDKVVFAVQKGEYDAGTVRTGVLERLHKNGKININDFTILAKKQPPDFPFLVSTELYPEWPFAKAASVSKELTERITIALLKLEANSEAAQKADISGWTVPLDYHKVHELYKHLKVGPYKNLGKVRMEDILNQYWHIVSLILILILLLTLIIVYILRLDKKVRKSQYSLAKAQEIAHIGNWEWHVHKNEMKWSEEVFHIFGLADKHLSLNIEHFMEGVHPDDREFVKMSLNDALYHKRPLNIDHRIVAIDGTVRMVHQQAETTYDELGKAIFMSGIIQDITERKSAENRLRESEQELASILNNMQDTFFRINYFGRVTSISPSVAQLLGYELEEALGKRFLYFVAKKENYKGLIDRLKSNFGRVNNYEMRLLHKSGTVLITAISAHYIYDESGDIEGIEGIARNISELVHTRDDLTREKEKIQTTLESIGDGVITTDITGVIEYMNAVAETLTGWKLANARGMRLFDVFKIKASSGEAASVDDILDDVLCEKTQTSRAIHEGILKSEDNKKYVVEVTFAPIRDHAVHLVGCVIVFHDVTEMHELGKKMAYQARHDALTGLLNRRELETRIDSALSASPSVREHALLYMDLDRFKEINDRSGHVAGDELLKQIADLFTSKIRNMDSLARIGGDKFCLLLQNCPLNQARNIGDTLLNAIRQYRFSWGGSVFKIGLNIGLVPFQNSGVTVGDIMSDADIACFNAKENGSNAMYVHQDTEDLVQQRQGEMHWVNRLNKAIDENRFVVYFQELIPLSAVDSQEKHYELLIRMKDEQGNVILPMAFIPAAERFKKIAMLDRWIFDRTLELIDEFQADIKHCHFTINLSGQSVADESFKNHVLEKIEKFSEFKNKLCFEISESAAISNYAATSSFIETMRQLGCQFSLDDFGNGVSSFSYLKNLHVDWVKIDGALVRNIADNQVEYTIVQSIHLIAQAMGRKTVAKCVENEQIEKCLRDIGVDYAQGYGLKKPEPFSSEIIVSKSA